MPFIGSALVGWPAPYCGQMASPSSRYFNASHLSKNGWPSVEIQWRNDLSGDGGGNGGDGGDRSDGWWLSGSHVFHVGPGCLYFYYIQMYIYVMQKLFYDTMKYKRMDGWYF